MADLRLEDLGKTFAPGIRAFDEVSLTVAAGECLALVGPSGCGKTTLLRVIAGLEFASAGTIHIDGVQVNDTLPHHREVGMLLQRPALLLQQTVRQNLRLAWTLRDPLALVRRWLGGERGREEDLLRIARLLELEPELDRPVQQLSGGQQQRVALGRCLLRKTKIMLLDEPLGHLDAPLRTDLRRQIRRLSRELGLTVLHVTHDPAEALAVGDRVAVMREGRVIQIDEPRQLRRFPTHRFVAELIHHEDGGFNWLPGEIVKQEFDVFFEGALGRWPLSLLVLDRLRESLYKGDEVAPSAVSPEVTGAASGILEVPNEKFLQEPAKVHIMMGIPASQVRCTTSRAETDDVCLPLQVTEIECSAAGNWVVGVLPQPGLPDLRWIGRADESERFERGQEVKMTFSMNQAYWFDAANGRTLFAPGG